MRSLLKLLGSLVVVSRFIVPILTISPMPFLTTHAFWSRPKKWLKKKSHISQMRYLSGTLRTSYSISVCFTHYIWRLEIIPSATTMPLTSWCARMIIHLTLLTLQTICGMRSVWQIFSISAAFLMLHSSKHLSMPLKHSLLPQLMFARSGWFQIIWLRRCKRRARGLLFQSDGHQACRIPLVT